MLFHPFGPSGGGDVSGAINEVAGRIGHEFEVRKRAGRIERINEREVSNLISVLGNKHFMKYLYEIKEEQIIRLPIAFGPEEIRLMIDPKEYTARIYGVVVIPGEVREVGEIQFVDKIPTELKKMGFVVKGEQMDHRGVVSLVAWRELEQEYFLGKASLVINALEVYASTDRKN